MIQACYITVPPLSLRIWLKSLIKDGGATHPCLLRRNAQQQTCPTSIAIAPYSGTGQVRGKSRPSYPPPLVCLSLCVCLSLSRTGFDAADIFTSQMITPPPPHRTTFWFWSLNKGVYFNIPHTFVTSGVGNNGASIFINSSYVLQTQPLYRCTPGSPLLTSFKTWELNPDPRKGPVGRHVTSLWDEGSYGAHGGSGLSSLGGMIRKGELNSSSPPIQHAVGIELYAHKYYYCSDKVNRTSCYRWPALTADSYALNVRERFGMDIACSGTCTCTCTCAATVVIQCERT